MERKMKKSILPYRMQVWKKYNGHCAYCGTEIAYEDMQIDHIVPRYSAHFEKTRLKELNNVENLNPSCRMCNFRKGTYSIEGFREEIKEQAKREMKRFQARMSERYGLIEYYPEREVEFYFEKNEKETDNNNLSNKI